MDSLPLHFNGKAQSLQRQLGSFNNDEERRQRRNEKRRAKRNAAYTNGFVCRTFAEGFGQQALDAAIRDTLISDIAKEFPSGLDDPASAESAEFGRRTHGLKTMDPGQLRHSLARVISDETARTGRDATSEYYSRVCHNLRGMSKPRGFLV